jgi:predicted RNase H-like nuclease
MVPVAGVDGCTTGWVIVTAGQAIVRRDFRAVVEALPEDAVIGVDMPVGLLDRWTPGGRACDRAARASLTTKRSSVFSAPPRAAFGARTLADAQARGCRMTIYSLAIMRKVQDVDSVITPRLQKRIFEVHPELSFMAMNRGRPLGARKKERAGRDERYRLLCEAGIHVPSLPTGAAPDDVFDACAAAWSAKRLAHGRGRRVPDPAPRDRRGLRMEICW